MRYETFTDSYDMERWVSSLKTDEGMPHWIGEWTASVGAMLIKPEERGEVDTELLRAIAMLGPTVADISKIADLNDRSPETRKNKELEVLNAANDLRLLVRKNPYALSNLRQTCRTALSQLN